MRTLRNDGAAIVACRGRRPHDGAGMAIGDTVRDAVSRQDTHYALAAYDDFNPAG